MIAILKKCREGGKQHKVGHGLLALTARSQVALEKLLCLPYMEVESKPKHHDCARNPAYESGYDGLQIEDEGNGTQLCVASPPPSSLISLPQVALRLQQSLYCQLHLYMLTMVFFLHSSLPPHPSSLADLDQQG